jgi:hypothetical protein
VCPAPQPVDEAEQAAPEPSASDASTDSTVPPVDDPDTASIAAAALVVTVDLGFERNVRNEYAELQVVGEGGAETIEPSEFRVISSDRRGSSGFVCVASVFPISPTTALAEVVIDAGRRSGLEGGTLEGQIVYTGPLELVSSEIAVEANLQSRAVYYLLALIPVIVLLAMYPVFDMWPPNLKRWWTSILAVGAPVVATYFATGLSNASWLISAAALGKLLAGSYGAGAAAAIAAKGAAHDLHDTNEEPSQGG